MKLIINSGVYQVDLHGSNDSEFNGNHPSIIVQTLHEEKIYYIIPLTSYTDEKWEKLRKYSCCKIPSANSIARIDKMQVRNKCDIPQRWFKLNRLIILTYDEMIVVHKKMRESFSLAFDKCEREYKKYYTQYTTFSDNCCKLFNGLINESGFITDDIDSGIFYYPLSCVNFLAFEDIKNAFYQYIKIKECKITYNKSIQNLNLEFDKNCEKLLTIKIKYDTIKCIEG